MIIDKIIWFIAKKLKKDKQEQEDLAFGLASGLVVGLAFGLGNYLIEISKASNSFPILLTIGILIIAFAEVMFWMEKKKPLEKESKFFFTIKRKLWNIAESSYMIGNVIGGFLLIKKGLPMLSDWLEQYGLSIMNFIGWGTLIILVIFAYVKINSLKYRRRK